MHMYKKFLTTRFFLYPTLKEIMKLVHSKFKLSQSTLNFPVNAQYFNILVKKMKLLIFKIFSYLLHAHEMQDIFQNIRSNTIHHLLIVLKENISKYGNMAKYIHVTIYGVLKDRTQNSELRIDILQTGRCEAVQIPTLTAMVCMIMVAA